MGFCGTCNVNHDGKQYCQTSYCNSHSGMLWQVNILFLIMVLVVLVRKGRSKLSDTKDAKNRSIVV